MEFKLHNDLVFLDLEATGLNIIRDRIVQIAMIKYFKDGRPEEEFMQLINPGIPISEEAMSVHGLTPDDLYNKPTFQQVGQKIYDFIGNADLSGYNAIRFDIPMLIEEFARIGLEFELNQRKLIDVQRIFYKMEPRTLKAAVKYYCDREFEDAHDAMADVRATIDVLKGQIQMYQDVPYTDPDGNTQPPPITGDIRQLHDFTNDMRVIDVTQKLKLDHKGVVVFNFGKYLGKPVAEVLSRDKNYYHWILNKEFSHQVKQIVRKVVRDYEQKNEDES